MIYFDTDVLIHYFFNQDPHKQSLAIASVGNAIRQNQFFISVLTLQETAFVLHKLGVRKNDIIQALSPL